MTGSPAALDGKVALITGGSKGIGFAIAETLVSRGARVMITGRNTADLERAQSRLGPHALSAPPTRGSPKRSSAPCRPLSTVTAGSTCS